MPKPVVTKTCLHIPLAHKILVTFSKYTLGLFSSSHLLINKKKSHSYSNGHIIKKGLVHNWSIFKNSIELKFQIQHNCIFQFYWDIIDCVTSLCKCTAEWSDFRHMT